MTDERKKSFRALKLSFPIQLSEDAKVPDMIHVIPVGTWDHPMYGPMVITPQDITQFVANFNDGLRKGVRITAGHEVYGGPELPAVGWFKELIDQGVDGLWAKIEWTKDGINLLSQKAFKFFSPEFYEIYEDPETRAITENVLVGGALTNSPYFKGLKAIVFSEPKIENQFNEKNMTIQELLEKNAADLTAEEKTYMEEQSAELAKSENDNEKALASQITKHLTSADNNAGEGDGDGAGADETAGEGGEKKEASEKKLGKSTMVQIDASELAALKDMANQGATAFAELRKSKLNKEVDAMVFSESNKKGKVLPKHKEKLFSFMESLTEVQLKNFTEIVSSIETKLIFGEVGDGKSGSAASANDKSLTEMTKAYMSEQSAKGIKLKFTDALRHVKAANPDLVANRDSSLEKAEDQE